jgi:hypothetical protein
MAARPRRGKQEPVGTGTAMRKHTFEVHSLRKGRWKIEATCDKREAAFDLARELVESPDKESVCVVEETYDRDNVKIVDRTILERAGRPLERPPRRKRRHALAWAARGTWINSFAPS